MPQVALVDLAHMPARRSEQSRNMHDMRVGEIFIQGVINNM